MDNPTTAHASLVSTLLRIAPFYGVPSIQAADSLAAATTKKEMLRSAAAAAAAEQTGSIENAAEKSIASPSVADSKTSPEAALPQDVPASAAQLRADMVSMRERIRAWESEFEATNGRKAKVQCSGVRHDFVLEDAAR